VISLSVCLFCVCLSVCLRACLWNRWTDLLEILCADPLLPWLDPPLAALPYGWLQKLSQKTHLTYLLAILAPDATMDGYGNCWWGLWEFGGESLVGGTSPPSHRKQNIFASWQSISPAISHFVKSQSVCYT